MYDTFTKRDGLPFDLCTAIIAAPDGTLWVGEHDIVNIRPTGNTWVLVSSHNRSEGGDIGLLHTVYSDSDSSIWAGGAYGAKHVSGVSKTPDPPVNDPNLKGEVYTFLRSSDGALWIGFADGVRRWDGKNWQTFGAQAGITIALDLAQDSNGTIWAATGLDGLKYFDGERWQPKPVLGATHDITTIAFIGGYLWVSGGGIIARTSDGGTNWQNLDQNGLAMGNVISSLVPDAENRVWIHSYNGIHYYKPER
jgi:ligand-binding sensor domain-containing protein